MNEQFLDHIRDSLHEDLASFGFLVQCMKAELNGCEPSRAEIQATLGQLLDQGDVCIGKASLANADYVQFTAWQSEPSQLIERAFRAVDGASERDKPFVFWLSLARNVDQFENPESSGM